jgi:repressor LexA
MVNPMHKELTEKQRTILEFLKDFLKDRGYPPSLRDICEHFGIKGPKNARKHLEAIERKGFIKRSPNISRAIEVFSPAKNAVSVPIAGRVKAGPPHLAVEDIQGHVTLDSRFFRPAGAFLLKVEGESMTGASMDDGDYILVRPQKVASNGDIVVAMLDDEATVKRFSKKGDSITLKPENPTMAPIRVKEGKRDFTIIGKVISVIKRMEG